MEPIKIFLIPGQKEAVFICPSCKVAKYADISKYQHINTAVKLKVKCSCSHKYEVILERRQYFRKKVELSGVVRQFNEEHSIKITNLSRVGIRIETQEPFNLEINDPVEVEFGLDGDMADKIIQKHAIVKRILKENHIYGLQFTAITGDVNDKHIGNYLMPNR